MAKVLPQAVVTELPKAIRLGVIGHHRQYNTLSITTGCLWPPQKGLSGMPMKDHRKTGGTYKIYDSMIYNHDHNLMYDSPQHVGHHEIPQSSLGILYLAMPHS